MRRLPYLPFAANSSSLMFGIFLSTMEVSIVSTALVDITNKLDAFQNSSWVINGYLLTFTGRIRDWWPREN